MESESPRVELLGVRKRFGGVEALADIHLAFFPGEVHALVGENGAGKSTLGKLVAGIHRPDGGTILVDGEAVDFGGPRDALAHRITAIAQEISLVPERSVMENVFLGMEPRRRGFVDVAKMRRRYRELEAIAGFGLSPDVPVRRLGIADQQRTEVLRALARDATLIVMDEPTAALTVSDAESLFELVRTLRDGGRTVVYVSHFLNEVLALADRVTVLRDGRLIRTAPAREETVSSLVTAMLGRDLTHSFPPKSAVPAEAPVALEVEHATGKGYTDISFAVRRGEIVGLAGLVGAGRTELARGVFGADRSQGGAILVRGAAVDVRSPYTAIRAGLAYLPESRKDDGLVMGRSCRENVTLANMGDVSTAGFVSRSDERAAAKDALARVGVPASRAEDPVWMLSGGNQQKVLFARWLFRNPEILLIDEPTRGVDVGAKFAIYELIVELARAGAAIVVISSEHEELVGLAHRVLVMRAGEHVAELQADDITNDNIISTAFAAEDQT